ncbi:MAG: hypothetical protein CMF63_01100 [Magnetovibrio sp.]|nr:hypothetical protein [Magnetovibrio sp.]
MRIKKHLLLVLITAAGLSISACVPQPRILDDAGDIGGDKGGPTAALSFARFPDIPLPSGADINVDQTLVFGGGESWFGRLVLSTSHDTFAMFDFFKQKLPEFGWREITSVRAATSVLTFSRRDRIANIQIVGRRLGGAESTITVSPQDAARQPPGSAPALPPPVNRVR